MVGCETTERLNETWVACDDHVPSVTRFLIERSAGWGILEDTIVCAELASPQG